MLSQSVICCQKRLEKAGKYPGIFVSYTEKYSGIFFQVPHRLLSSWNCTKTTVKVLKHQT